MLTSQFICIGILAVLQPLFLQSNTSNITGIFADQKFLLFSLPFGCVESLTHTKFLERCACMHSSFSFSFAKFSCLIYFSDSLVILIWSSLLTYVPVSTCVCCCFQCSEISIAHCQQHSLILHFSAMHIHC